MRAHIEIKTLVQLHLVFLIPALAGALYCLKDDKWDKAIVPVDTGDDQAGEELIFTNLQMDTNKRNGGDLRTRSLVTEGTDTETREDADGVEKRTLGRPWACDTPEPHWIRFSDDFFPNRVKNYTCVTNSCYCTPSTYQMKLLKRRSPEEIEEDFTVPSSLRSEWISTTRTLVTCCNCRRVPL